MILKPSDFSDIVIAQRGDLFLALLATQQVYSRPLTEKEVMSIFFQGIKDPSIIDRQARLGSKAHLLTYHAQTILGIDRYLIPSMGDKKPDVTIGSLTFSTVAYSRHFVYSTRTEDDIDVTEVTPIISYVWV